MILNVQGLVYNKAVSQIYYDGEHHYTPNIWNTFTLLNSFAPHLIPDSH